MNGIPYMGSKRKIAPHIVKTLISRHPEATHFYDVFGGGGAVSLEALKYSQLKVHYNELNTAVYSLLKYLKENKVLGVEFYKWISREDFFELIKGNDYFAGFVQSCWSFGNNQKCYIYGKEIMKQKRLSHEIIVNKCEISAFQLGFNEPELFKIKDLHKRRKVFCKFFKDSGNRNDIQNIERIQELEQIQELERIQELELTNLSFENLSFENNCIIYCDPPYIGTAEYKEGVFNHKEFYKWFENLEHPAYLSEYTAPFECIEQQSHRSTLSRTNNKKVVKEKLFWNGKGKINNYKLF